MNRETGISILAGDCYGTAPGITDGQTLNVQKEGTPKNGEPTKNPVNPSREPNGKRIRPW